MFEFTSFDRLISCNTAIGYHPYTLCYRAYKSWASMRRRSIAICIGLVLAVIGPISMASPDSVRQGTSASPKSNAENPTREGVITPEMIVANRRAQLEEISKQANVPISFYGRIVDQDNRPIVSVQVIASVRYYGHPNADEGLSILFDERVLETDSKGEFQYLNGRGQHLVVRSLQKDGYEPAPSSINQSYQYHASPTTRFVPNAGTPVVFRMWKKAPSQPLIRTPIAASIRCDGSPVRFDLLTGEQSDTGGLEVRLERSPVLIEPGQRNFRWSLRVEIVDGGLIESKDEQMYLAPAEGYKPVDIFMMTTDDKNWKDDVSLNFYVRARDGASFSRLEMKVLAGAAREAVPLYITAFTNANDSRILE